MVDEKLHIIDYIIKTGGRCTNINCEVCPLAGIDNNCQRSSAIAYKIAQQAFEKYNNIQHYKYFIAYVDNTKQQKNYIADVDRPIQCDKDIKEIEDIIKFERSEKSVVITALQAMFL